MTRHPTQRVTATLSPTDTTDPALEQRDEAPVRPGGVTLRVVVFSLLLAVVFGYCIPIVDYKYNDTFLGGAHLPAGAVAALLLLLLVVNPLIRLVSRRWTFSRNEVLTVYITCLFSTLVPGRGGENFWIPNVLASFYYATRENRWLSFLADAVRPWMTPALKPDGTYNAVVTEGWYVGISPDAPIPWHAWLVPIAAWGAVIFALYVMLACLAVILRAQWSEYEALSFPLLRLPLEMTRDVDHGPEADPQGRFFRSRVMWVGFGLAAGVQLLNGLHLYFPDIPLIPLRIDSGGLFTEVPWNQMGGLRFEVWPIAVGISYLLTTEVSLSLWFFFMFHKFQLILAYYLGFMPSSLPDPIWTRGFGKAFISYQQIGAFFAYSAVLLWIGREHYKFVALRAVGLRAARPAEKDEALPYPVAFWGFVLSSLFLLGWTVAAGVRLDIALSLWVTYFVVALVLTRVVIEGGLLLVHSGWMPLGPISHLTGSWIPASSGVPAAFIGGALMTEFRGFLLPSFVHSFKLAHDRRIPARPLLVLIFACILVASAVSWYTIINLGYRFGGLQLQQWWANGPGGQAPARNAKDIVDGVRDTYLLNWLWFGLGAAFTAWLMWMRSRFLWFPLHPIGYVMFAPFAITALWFSIFLGWLAKTLIMRFGGSSSYRAMVPFFLGLALGDVTMMIFWNAINVWQGRMNYSLMPG